MNIEALIAPVQKQSLDRAAAEKVRYAIVTGAVAPGARLLESALATSFGLSRGTVRAALQRLVTEGLVVQRPYAGWEVASLSAQDSWELYTLRAALEALAAGLAAEKIDPVSRQSLSSAFDDLKRAAREGDHNEITDADFALHKTIVALSKHRRLIEQYALVEQQVRMYIASANARLPKRELVAREHMGFVKAVAKGDGELASRLIREHSLVFGRDLVQHLETQERKRSSNQDHRDI